MWRRTRSASALPIAALFAAGVLGGTAHAATPQTVRVGKAPALPSSAQAIGPLPAAQRLQLTVALKSQDASGLASYAEAVASPSSPLFRDYLSVAQFAQRFGATPAQVQTVRAALQAQRLTVGAPTANELTIPVRGTAQQVEAAFSTSISQVELRDGRVAYANAQAPSLPAHAAPYVQGVIGLSNVARDQSQHVLDTRPADAKRGAAPDGANASGVSGQESTSGVAQIATGGPQPCEAAIQTSDEFGAITADQAASAYALPSLYQAGDRGAGQTIALFEQEGFEPSDIAEYQRCYGTSTVVTPIDVDGGPEVSTEGDAEAALDIEQVIGLAPEAHIIAYQGPIEQEVAPIDILNAIVSDDTAKVISSSWGLCEGFTEFFGPEVIPAENTVLQEAAAQGQSFFVASGDSGSEQCSQVEIPEIERDTELSVENPASQPFATGVGGSSIYSRDSEGATLPYDGTLPVSEGVWNNGPRWEGGGGSGGGVSQRWPMPGYQSSAAASLGVSKALESSGEPCGATGGLCREVPDVSADADPDTGYVVHADFGPHHGGDGWHAIGGTSAAAPLWAAFTGLVNASSACEGRTIGFANPSLYALAGSDYASNFRDVFEASPIAPHFYANNDTVFGTGLYPVLPGYDMATGLGAPLGSALATSLCALTVPKPAPPTPQQIAPAAASPTPAPATASSPPAVATVSSAQIKAALLAALSVPRSVARVAALLKLGRFPLSFDALEPGSLMIGWYQLPHGATVAKPKPVLVASARVTFTAAGRRTIRLSLTSAGRALLRRSKQLKLTAKATFTPRGKTPVSATKSFQLKR
jgi:subtilase family serine protease